MRRQPLPKKTLINQQKQARVVNAALLLAACLPLAAPVVALGQVPVLKAIVGAGIPSASAATTDRIEERRNRYTDDLPRWEGSPKDLTALSFSVPQVSVPAFMQGVKVDTSGVLPRFFLYLDRPAPEAGTLPDGWIVDQPRQDLAPTRFKSGKLLFTLRQPSTGKSDSWAINAPRVKTVRSEPDPAVHTAIVMGNRYFAFRSTDQSFLFFDRQTGKFVPQGIQASSRPVKEKCAGEKFNFVFTCGPDTTYLFQAADGQYVVSNPVRGDFRKLDLP